MIALSQSVNLKRARKKKKRRMADSHAPPYK
jgi:hypothetical protein